MLIGALAAHAPWMNRYCVLYCAQQIHSCVRIMELVLRPSYLHVVCDDICVIHLVGATFLKGPSPRSVGGYILF